MDIPASPSTIQAIAIDDLQPYGRNARKHPPWQLDQIAASIKKFGFTVPILMTPDHTIIAGHGRVEAAKMLGIETVNAIVIPDGWTRDDIAAYVLTDNQIALNAEWDSELLKFEVAALDASGFDLSVIGFSDADLARILHPDIPDIDPTKAWDGMPDFSQPDATAFRTISVNMLNQSAVDAFSALVGQHITTKTKSIWFPDAALGPIDKEYV